MPDKTREEKYKAVSEYCIKKICSKLADCRKGNCALEYFCRKPIISYHGSGKSSRLPDIIGMDLDVAYEILTDN